MTIAVTWQEIGLRLMLTFVAGALIGLNRGEQDRPVGMRTTLLVCLAASVSMLQVNLLLSMSGKTPESFVVLDLMRLPLGILSGMGFIGGGAILRKGNRTVGVTTAATLWFVTVIGLCIGGGQKILGMVSLALALFTLDLMKRIEKKLPHKHTGLLTLEVRVGKGSPEALIKKIQSSGHKVVPAGRVLNVAEERMEYSWEISWESKSPHPDTPNIVNEVESFPGVCRLKWIPEIPSEA